MSDDKIFSNRLSELAERAYASGRCTFTGFLGLAELDTLNRMKRELAYAGVTLYGGADGCERVIARFGAADDDSRFSFPISCIKAEPAEKKFADRLSHRDILGALMAIGIERDMTGDIYLLDNTAYIFCLEKVRDIIIGELKSAKRTTLRLSPVDSLPDGIGENAAEERILVSSERVDVLICAAYRLSRSEAAGIFAEKRVFLDGRMCADNSDTVKPGTIVSVRSLGRFRYIGYDSTSRKGKLYARITRWS